MWSLLAALYLRGLSYAFDDRVKVKVPQVTEDWTRVPIGADAREFYRTDEIMMTADLHPFPQVLRFEPLAALPFLTYR